MKSEIKSVLPEIPIAQPLAAKAKSLPAAGVEVGVCSQAAEQPTASPQSPALPSLWETMVNWALTRS